MSNGAIAILATGGTFDKAYNELLGQLYFNESHVGEMLTLGRSRLKVTLETLMMVDSLEMTADHRGRIIERCRMVEATRIVITHGTDTMELTARSLAEAGIERKTIILTGAMIPYKFGSSDGLFNLGSALAFVQTLSAGVYVAMNGCAMRAECVHKNRETGFFEDTCNS